MKRSFNKALLMLLACFVTTIANSQKQHIAPKPLFVDSVYDGAADPVVVWNKKAKKWFMFYTNRRASATGLDGVTWVHGTRIGIASSVDGATWKYVDTADIQYRPDSNYTHWAPEVFENKGLYHMYLTYVPGVFKDWNHPREIIHLTSKDLLHWQYDRTLELASHKIIDACAFPLPDGGWRLWYNNEKDKKSIYYADSKDLVTWQDKGKAVGDKGGEGPKVFRWKDHYWMIVDNWMGMSIYQSDDLTTWKRQEKRILELPGTGKDDQAIGGHCDVLVNDGRAYVFYFTHPGRLGDKKTWKDGLETRRSVIQLGELKYENGEISCNRDEAVNIQLKH